MNISITNTCNRRCQYCFQKGWYLSDRTFNNQSTQQMSVEMFEDVVKWSCLQSASIMGGEPFLHTQINQIVDCANRLLPQSILWISNLSVDPQIIRSIDGFNNRHACLANIDYTTDKHRLAMIDNIDTLIDRQVSITLSTTLTGSTEFSHLVSSVDDLVNRFPTINRLRVGTMCPIPNQPFVRTDYSRLLVQLCDYFKGSRLIISADCQIPPFEANSDVKRYLRMNGFRVHSKSCYSNPPTDVLVDGSVIWCSSCKSIATNYKNHQSLLEAKQYLRSIIDRKFTNPYDVICFAKHPRE